MANYIAFNLEGTLTPDDSARGLLALIPDGDRILEVLSRYESLLLAENREGYESGDVFALTAPLLVLHNISESDIGGLAGKARFVSGATDLVSKLEYAVWKIFCLTATYEQYATHVTHKLGIYAQRVACTRFAVNRLEVALSKNESELLKQLESETLALYRLADDQRVRQRLDYFYRERLPSTDIGRLLAEVKPIGGRRKLAAIAVFADQNSQPLSRWVAVGSGIADARMLRSVEQSGGLAIALNAESDLLAAATVGLASTNIYDLMDLLQVWATGQRKAVEKLVKEREKTGGKGNRGYFHWLPGRQDLRPAIVVHERMRGMVREGTT